jgi:Arc/MetJ family transcription regulator
MGLCKMMCMATNLALDDTLIVEAQKIGHHRTKKAAVTQALVEYIQRHRQSEISELFGKIDFAPGYDPKSLRNRR